MYTTLAIVAVIGLITGASVCGIMTKMNLAKAHKLQVAVLILKQENQLLRNKLVKIEKLRTERFQRKLYQVRNRTKPKKNND